MVVMEHKSKEKPNLCYQCGKCSAGCPVAEEMDILPHQVMHMISLGRDEKVLSSNTMWICAGCFTCAVRCPNDIDITTVMDEMRIKAIKTGAECKRPEILKFHQTFLSNISGRGRLYEMGMMGKYNLITGKPFHNMSLAPKMLLTGRLHLLPPKRIKGFKGWMQKIWKAKTQK
ncbi:4Fe-4S dicluster domain-containing protein [Planctomycetota bacterium]